MSFPADIKSCMKDCILALFWPKEQIVGFFSNGGCTKADLAGVQNYKADNLSRRKIVDSVFEALSARTDGGIGQFRAMLKSLITWSHFDSYYLDNLKKLNRAEAEKHINHLRQLQEIRDHRLKEEQSRTRDAEQKARTASTTAAEIKEKYLLLFGPSGLTSQQRGYELEAVLRELARLSSLETTEPFRIGSEQIDGAVKYEGEHYLIEAKWHDEAASNEPLYQFAGKVEGKMYGRGIFISINGYSKKVVQDLVTGKAIKTILVDGADLTFVVEGSFTFAEMIDRKVKAAQTKGLIYVDPRNGKQK